jgi:hypothetical protein
MEVDGYEEDVICDLVTDLVHYAEMMGRMPSNRSNALSTIGYAEKNDEADTEISISITEVYR